MVKNYHAGALLSPALERLCNKKLAKLDKYADDLVCDIFMSMEGKEQLTKMVLKSRRFELVAKSKSDDMYKNIYTCVDCLKLQISKEKFEKRQKRRIEAPALEE